MTNTEELGMDNNMVDKKKTEPTWYSSFIEIMEEFQIEKVLKIVALIKTIEESNQVITQEIIDSIKKQINELTFTVEEEIMIFERYSPEVKTLKASSEVTNFIRKKISRKTRLLENRIERSISQDFGSYLKELRLKKGFSLKDVENITGISPSYTNRIEKGERKAPSYPIIEKLATAYKVPVQDLLTSAGLKASEDTNIKSLSQIIFTNNFTINDNVIPADKKEVLNELLDALETMEWSNETKHFDSINVIDIISRYKSIK